MAEFLICWPNRPSLSCGNFLFRMEIPTGRLWFYLVAGYSSLAISLSSFYLKSTLFVLEASLVSLILFALGDSLAREVANKWASRLCSLGFAIGLIGAGAGVMGLFGALGQ